MEKKTFHLGDGAFALIWTDPLDPINVYFQHREQDKIIYEGPLSKLEALRMLQAKGQKDAKL